MDETMICENVGPLEMQYLINPPICLNCGKPMKPGYDEIQCRISGFVWTCNCLPKDMRMCLL